MKKLLLILLGLAVIGGAAYVIANKRSAADVDDDWVPVPDEAA